MKSSVICFERRKTIYKSENRLDEESTLTECQNGQLWSRNRLSISWKWVLRIGLLLEPIWMSLHQGHMRFLSSLLSRWPKQIEIQIKGLNLKLPNWTWLTWRDLRELEWLELLEKDCSSVKILTKAYLVWEWLLLPWLKPKVSLIFPIETLPWLGFYQTVWEETVKLQCSQWFHQLLKHLMNLCPPWNLLIGQRASKTNQR